MTPEFGIKMWATLMLASLAMLGIGMVFYPENPERVGKICLPFALIGLGFFVAAMWRAF